MNSHTLWYMTRATGIVALVLLTATTVLGIVTTVRFSTPAWPRFAWQDLHRRLSLVAVVFVGLHVASTVLDGYAPIGWLSAIVPFTSPYRRLWLGLGTVAVDLLLAVGISSALRARIRPVTWRALHWLAYASWPLAVVHGLGTGTDPRLHWVVLLVALCTSAVVGAALWRITSGWPRRAGARVGAGAVGAASLLAVTAWTAQGPLKAGWAARAGTPPSLLGRTVAATPPAASSPAQSPAGTLPATPYDASFSGTITERSLSGGAVEIDIAGQTAGAVQALLRIQLVGAPAQGGGIVMQRGSAAYGPPSSPMQYQGQVVGLEGSRLELSLTDASGTPLDLRLAIAIDGSSVSGTLRAGAPVGVGAGGGDDR